VVGVLRTNRCAVTVPVFADRGFSARHQMIDGFVGFGLPPNGQQCRAGPWAGWGAGLVQTI
jgi:hypothetical protein